MIATLNAWGATWAAWFGPLVLQDTLFLGLVFLALRVLRDAPPRVRAAVATVGVVKLALPAFVTVVRPAAEAVAPGAGAGAVSTLLLPFADGSAGAPAGPAWSGGLAPAAILMVAWVSVAVSRLGFVALQTLQLAQAVRGAEDIDPRDLPADVRCSGLAVRRSPRIPMPLSFGPWPRTIYVPAAWDRWGRAARHAVLRHELAHVQRRDGLVLSLEILVQAAWCFHPLVFLLIRRLRTWREMACDDRCLAADPDARVAYTRFLAGLAERALTRPVVAESASTLLRGRSELLSRVTHQLEESAMKPVPKLRVILVTVLLAMAVAPLSLVLADPPPPRQGGSGAARTGGASRARRGARPGRCARSGPHALSGPHAPGRTRRRPRGGAIGRRARADPGEGPGCGRGQDPRGRRRGGDLGRQEGGRRQAGGLGAETPGEARGDGVRPGRRWGHPLRRLRPGPGGREGRRRQADCRGGSQFLGRDADFQPQGRGISAAALSFPERIFLKIFWIRCSGTQPSERFCIVYMEYACPNKRPVRGTARYRFGIRGGDRALGQARSPGMPRHPTGRSDHLSPTSTGRQGTLETPIAHQSGLLRDPG